MEDSTVAEQTKAEITSVWDCASEGYDLCWGHGLRTPQERLAWQQMLAALLPPARPLRVLDAGCGTGFLALLLADAGHDVTGIDLSDRMLTAARLAADAAGLSVRFSQGDAERPTGQPGSYDAVVSRHLLWTLPDPDAAARAWATLVGDGGQVIAIDGLWRPSRSVDRLAIRAGRMLERLAGGQPDTGEYPPELARKLPMHTVTSLEPARALFVRAGLHGVVAAPLTELDAVERSAMPLNQRLQLRHRRYLVRGRTAAG